MKNLLSIVPLSYKSKVEDISSFFYQVSNFRKNLDIIIVLEKDDFFGYNNWLNISNNFKKFKVTLEMLKDKSSKGACLNRAIYLCKTKYFLRCDMDDQIYENRFFETEKLIKNSPNNEVDLIYSDLFDLRNKKIIKYPNPSFLSLSSIWRNPIPAPTVCIRKEFLEKNRIFYPPFNRCEDLFLVFKFIDNKATIKKISKPLVGYSNNILLKRDYKNWLYNSLVRFQRNRFDLIGLLSFIVGLLIFNYGVTKFLYLKFKNHLNKFIKLITLLKK